MKLKSIYLFRVFFIVVFIFFTYSKLKILLDLKKINLIIKEFFRLSSKGYLKLVYYTNGFSIINYTLNERLDYYKNCFFLSRSGISQKILLKNLNFATIYVIDLQRKVYLYFRIIFLDNLFKVVVRIAPDKFTVEKL